MRAIALRRFEVPGTLLVLAALACSAEPAGPIRGEVQSYIATLDDGRSQESYTLRTLDGEPEVPLTFTRDPLLASGQLVDVWGAAAGGKITVERFDLLGDAPGDLVESVPRAIRNGPAYRARTFAFVLVDTSRGTVPLNLSEVEATRRLFGTELGLTPSVRQYYLEASYGRQDVTGQVFGPLAFGMTGCNTGALADTLTPMIPGAYDHYLWYIHPRNVACNWSGLAQGGRPDRPSKNTWYNAASGCVVLVQEPGHNFGMSHSSAMKCGSAPFVDGPSGVCSHQEYGDRYDPMGGGCRHMNAYQKAYQGWFGGCNLVQAASSATVTLLPLELACDGVQALQVPMPKVRPYLFGGASLTELTHYYLELRAPRGIDRGLGPVVQVRVSSDTRSRDQRGVRTWFLDMKPETAALEGLLAGESFADPTGSPRFTVESIDDTRATVRVEIDGRGPGAPICGDGSLLAGPGPGPETCAATPSGTDGTPPPGPGPPPPTGTPVPPPAGAPGTVSTTDPLVTGCGCRMGSGGARSPALAVLLLALAAVRRRRRRTRAVSG
jgi:MYXO-CTERM domain-containing protein